MIKSTLRIIPSKFYILSSFNSFKIAGTKVDLKYLFSHSFQSFSNNNKTKIIKVIKDENNLDKILYCDFDDQVDNKDKIVDKQHKTKNRIKIFGDSIDFESESEKTRSHIKIKNNSANKLDTNNFNIFNQDSLDSLDKPVSETTEELSENILNYNQFFSDFCRVYIKAGDGGNGSLSVMKGPLYDQVSPQGGDGGCGGNVILKADDTVSSLARLRKAHFMANDGENGYIKAQDGKNAKDTKIHLPVGTLVYEIVRGDNYNFPKKDLRKLLVDLDHDGKEFIICKGGKGGIGNFTKRNLRKGDKLIQGQKGEEKELEFVLKCIADVGFIGFPNAGKSTLLGSLTRAVPKIASYPFTTLHPNLGKLRYKDDQTLNIADLPGLIEGAHENKGLGHKFLKHVERTKILLFLLDGSIDPSLNLGRNPLKDYVALKNELKLYDDKIDKKPSLVVFNKIDLNKNIFDLNFKEFFENTGIQPIKISGRTGEGLEILTDEIVKIVDSIKNLES